MVLVFDGEIALEALGFEFFEYGRHIRDPGSVRHVMRLQAQLVQIFQVAADDAAFQNTQTVDRLEAGAEPVAGVRAHADPPVAVFDQREDVIKVPRAIAGVIRPARMVVECERGNVFLNCTASFISPAALFHQTCQEKSAARDAAPVQANAAFTASTKL